MWEDKANKRGGRWLLSLDKKQRGHDLDRYWLDIVCFAYPVNITCIIVLFLDFVFDW